MQFSKMFPRVVVALVAVSFFAAAETRAQKYEAAGLDVPPPQPDLFEVSLGFNYIYLNDQFPETKNLYGLDTSLFVNATSWLGVGGDFIGDVQQLPQVRIVSLVALVVAQGADELL